MAKVPDSRGCEPGKKTSSSVVGADPRTDWLCACPVGINRRQGKKMRKYLTGNIFFMVFCSGNKNINIFRYILNGILSGSGTNGKFCHAKDKFFKAK
jgi:hypothetical protein